MNNWGQKLIRAAFVLSFILISFALESESSSEDLNDLDKISVLSECDTLLPVAIELIRIDSIETTWCPYCEDKYYVRQFQFYEMEYGDSARKPLPFLKEVHDSLDLNALWERKGLDTIFDQTDLDKFYGNNIPLEKDCYPSYNIISKDSISNWTQLYEEDYEKVKSPKYFSLSRPLISKNGNYMLLEFDDNCYGLCSSGHTFLFARTDRGWVKVWSQMRWIS